MVDNFVEIIKDTLNPKGIEDLIRKLGGVPIQFAIPKERHIHRIRFVNSLNYVGVRYDDGKDEQISVDKLCAPETKFDGIQVTLETTGYINCSQMFKIIKHMKSIGYEIEVDSGNETIYFKKYMGY